MSYIISGPTTIGTSAQLNTILGNVKFNDISTTQGSVFYVNSSGNLAGLNPGVSGQVLTTQGGSANPIWATIPTPSTVGFSAAANSNTISSTPAPITSWNINSPTGATVNPFFNNGSVFDLGTGAFTPSTTGKYQIDAYIEYSITDNADYRTLQFCDFNGGVYHPLLQTSNIQPSGDIGANQVLNIHQTINVSSSGTYFLVASISGGSFTDTVTTNSRFSAIFIGS